MAEPFDLSGELALVTGASRGIGAVIADMLADAGATVIGTATTAEGVQRICDTPGNRPTAGAAACVLDVSRSEKPLSPRRTSRPAKALSRSS